MAISINEQRFSCRWWLGVHSSKRLDVIDIIRTVVKYLFAPCTVLAAAAINMPARNIREYQPQHGIACRHISSVTLAIDLSHLGVQVPPCGGGAIPAVYR